VKRPFRYAHVGLGFAGGTLAWLVVTLLLPRRGFPEGIVLLPLLLLVGLGLAVRRPSSFLEPTVGTIIAGCAVLTLFGGHPVDLRAAQASIFPAILESSATLVGELLGVAASRIRGQGRHRCA